MKTIEEIQRQRPERNKSSFLKKIIKLSVVVILLTILVMQNKIDLSAFSFTSQSFFYIALALVLLLIQMFLCIVRFFYLIKGAGFECGFYASISYSMVGQFFSIFAIGNLGGDLVKGYMLGQHLPSKLEAFVIVTFDRLIGLAGLLIITMLASMAMFYKGDILMGGGVGQVLIGIAILCAFFFMMSLCFLWRADTVPAALLQSRPFTGKALLIDIIQAVLYYKGKWKVLSLSLFLSIASQLFTAAAVWCCALALLGLDAPTFSKTLFASTAGFLANLAPLPAGGIGAGELAFAGAINLLQNQSVHAAISWANIFLLFRFVLIACSFWGLFFYLSDFGKKPNKRGRR